MQAERFPKYWCWLVRGSGGRPGYTRVVDGWLLLHMAVGGLLGFIVWLDVATAASAVLLPLAGVFVGLSFAWAGNAQALLQLTEIEEVAEHHQGGYVDYVFAYQTAILVILFALVCWATAALQIFDAGWPTPRRAIAHWAVKGTLFALLSAALRSSWHVVLGTQWMLLIRREMKRSHKLSGLEARTPPPFRRRRRIRSTRQGLRLRSEL